MINRVVLVGRLTKDPELRYTPSGLAVVRFTLAVNRQFANGNGEREADFINCVAWRKQAENLANFQKKGNLLGVEGRIQTGSYEGQDGKRVYTTEVVADAIQFLESKNSNNNNSTAAPPQHETPSHSQMTPDEIEAERLYQQRLANYQRSQQQPKSEDPFAPGNRAPIEVSEDDLPF